MEKSPDFSVSNGVRQGGVLSPVLFTVYINRLLQDLQDQGIGCYWGKHYTGVFAYADNIVLLAPSASALRQMLKSKFVSACGKWIQVGMWQPKYWGRGGGESHGPLAPGSAAYVSGNKCCIGC